MTAGLALAAPSQARATGLALPAPTGAYRVGVTDLHLVDQDRADPWVPERRRELMVSLWFPATGRGGAADPYTTPAESRLILEQLRATTVPPEALSTVRTFARTGIRALPGPSRPLVVLSPGFSYPRTSLTALAEDLASRGYVVAGIDHTYEAAAITFPDGRITTCLVCTLSKPNPVLSAQITSGRAADTSFVLDELTRHRLPSGIRVDATRIAMAGHSIGGTSAAETMLRDRRIDAGINMDGTFAPPLARPLHRPFLMLGAEVHGRPGADPTWDTTWQHLTGWRRWLTVTGTTHASFTDYATIGEQAGLPVQPLSGDRCADLTRTYVAAFMDRHLRHRGTLLAGPSPENPEVVFQA
ncbi:lipase [Actinoplanes friuliensis DSM 7358]|uniref:Lipase n=2 Tax=Actinoplanes friuliensis TaxID=196914 RepID=U5W2H3_9ACTN|nr:lipase [Actinoplanes friuliensis DSM 7358]